MRNSLIFVAAVSAVSLLYGCANETVSTSAPGGYAWNAYSDPTLAKLAYGAPNSDEVGLMFSCKPRSGRIVVSSPTDVGKSGLVLSSGRTRSAVDGRSVADAMTGERAFEGHAPADAPVLAAFARSGELTVQGADRPLSMPASRADRGRVRAFLDACRA